MFEKWLAAFREQTRVIAETPAAAYGAAMTGMVVLLFYVVIKIGLRYEAAVKEGNKRELEATITYGTKALEAQAHEFAQRDSARMWQVKYEMLLLQLKKEQR